MTDPVHPAEQILVALIESGDWFNLDGRYYADLTVDASCDITDEQLIYITSLRAYQARFGTSGGTSPTGTTSSTDQEGTT